MKRKKSIANKNFDVDIKFRSFFVKSTGYPVIRSGHAFLLECYQYVNIAENQIQFAYYR